MAKRPPNIKSKLEAAARKVHHYFWREPDKALQDAKVGFRFRCKVCRGLFNILDVAKDHREPVVPPDEPGPSFSIEEGAKGWDRYYTRMFVPAAAYDICCNWCHHEKTQAENKIRAARRRKAKKNG